MEGLYIAPTKASPEIDFNPQTGILRISGQSYPENAFQFFEPVFEWLDRYFNFVTEETLFEIKMIYLNTSSTKCMMDIMYKIDNAYQAGKKIIINWYYNARNRNILECGEDFMEDMHVTFNLLETEL